MSPNTTKLCVICCYAVTWNEQWKKHPHMFSPDAASWWFWSTVLRYRSGLHCRVHAGVNKETLMHVLPVKVQVLLAWLVGLWICGMTHCPLLNSGDSVYQIGKNQSFKVIDIENRRGLSRGLGAAANERQSCCSRSGNRCTAQHALAAGQHNKMLEMPSSWCMFYTRWKHLPSLACLRISCFQTKWSLPGCQVSSRPFTHLQYLCEQKPKMRIIFFLL